MKLRDRFKKALFSFFKQEILKEVGAVNKALVPNYAETDYLRKEVELINVEGVIRLVDHPEGYGIPIQHVYERNLEDLKRELFEEAMKYVEIDQKSVLEYSPVLRSTKRESRHN